MQFCISHLCTKIAQSGCLGRRSNASRDLPDSDRDASRVPTNSKTLESRLASRCTLEVPPSRRYIRPSRLLLPFSRTHSNHAPQPWQALFWESANEALEMLKVNNPLIILLFDSSLTLLRIAASAFWLQTSSGRRPHPPGCQY